MTMSWGSVAVLVSLPEPSCTRSQVGAPAADRISRPMNRKLCAPAAVWMADPTLGPATSFGMTAAYEGVTRVPGEGRLLSAALVRTVIQAVPALFGSMNGPWKV